MKRFKLTLLYALFLLLCFDGALSAQLPSWQWGKRGGTPTTPISSGAFETVLDMATDPNGNVYVLARLAAGLVSDVDGHTGYNYRDGYCLASWDCRGDFRWLKGMGQSSSEMAYLGVDSLGGVYISGFMLGSDDNPLYPFNGHDYIEDDTIIPSDHKKMCIAKFDTSGHFKWLRRPQPDTSDYRDVWNVKCNISGMSVSLAGDIYLMGYYNPGLYADGYVIAQSGFYVIRYNKDGVFQETIPMDIETTNQGSTTGTQILEGVGNIALYSHFSRDNHNGRFYICGRYNPDMGTLKFGSVSIQSALSAQTGLDGNPIFLAAFSADGSCLWSKQSDADNYGDITSGAEFDKNGNIYVSGGIYINNTFNGYTSDSNQSGAPFVMSMDSSGNLLWASNAKITMNCSATGGGLINGVFGVDGFYGKLIQWDTLKVTTTSPNPMLGNYSIFMTRFNALTGDVISLDSIHSNTPNTTSSTLTYDLKGNFYVGGRFAYQLFPGNDTLTSIGGHYDWFVAKFGWENCNCEVPVPDFSASGGANFGMSFTYSGSTANSYEWDFGDGSSSGSGANPSHTYPHAGSYRVCVTASNSCGSNNTCRTITVGTTGIGEIPGFAEVSVYPNPATQTLTISGASSGTRLGIYDALGRLMLNKTLKGGKDQIDVRQLSAGIYIMRFTDKEGRRGNVKFVKE